MPAIPRQDQKAAHWKRLGVIPGAPECVIKAAHLAQIKLHHPDRGGDAEAAKKINIAYDELKGAGSAANEYVAAHYHAEPWVVLGITSAADPALVQRAGKQLAAEVSKLPRLAERVEWAIANFTQTLPPAAAAASRAAAAGAATRIRASAAPIASRGPRGLESWVNLGDIYWREARRHTMALTWPDAVPQRIAIRCEGAVRADLRRSSTEPSRCELDVSIDWDASGAGAGKRRVVNGMVSIKWPGSRGFTTKVTGTLLPYASPNGGHESAAADETPPAQPALPDGLPAKLDLGRIEWRADATRTIQLTWHAFAPYEISVDAPGPLRAEVTASKVMPGRFSVALSVDWDATAFSPGPTVRGYTLDVPVVVRWGAGGEAEVRVKGLIIYPALVTPSPAAVDLGAVTMGQQTRTSLVLISSAVTEVEIVPTAWLQRVDGSGRVLDGPLRLATNVPVRVEFRVHWPPIAERATASFAAGKPVRPTGRLLVRWDGRAIEVPVQMTVPPPKRSAR